jgi:adenosylhomocysteine nucleosidase
LGHFFLVEAILRKFDFASRFRRFGGGGVPTNENSIFQGSSGIISFGVAGGLAPNLVVGDWVAAAAIRTANQVFPTDKPWTRSLLERLPQAVHAQILGMDSPVADPLEKQALHTETGAAAVDMESHIAAKIAATHGIPFVACRAIIDPADKPLPPAALIGLRPDGTADIPAVFLSVVQKPSQLAALVRTACDAWIARAALHRDRQMLSAGLGFPNFEGGRSYPVALGGCHQHTDPPHPLGLLRTRRERPSRCAAE